MKERNVNLDIVRIIAALMVLFVHVGYEFPWIGDYTWTGYYGVMLFFVLSGYFAWPMIETRDWHKLGRNIRCYLQPALFAGVLFTLIGLAIGLVNHTPHDVVIRLVRSVFVDPWFITTLIECQVLFFCPMCLGGVRPVVVCLLFRQLCSELCVVHLVSRELYI